MKREIIAIDHLSNKSVYMTGPSLYQPTSKPTIITNSQFYRRLPLYKRGKTLMARNKRGGGVQLRPQIGHEIIDDSFFGSNCFQCLPGVLLIAKERNV